MATSLRWPVLAIQMLVVMIGCVSSPRSPCLRRITERLASIDVSERPWQSLSSTDVLRKGNLCVDRREPVLVLVDCEGLHGSKGCGDAYYFAGGSLNEIVIKLEFATKRNGESVLKRIIDTAAPRRQPTVGKADEIDKCNGVRDFQWDVVGGAYHIHRECSRADNDQWQLYLSIKHSLLLTP